MQIRITSRFRGPAAKLSAALLAITLGRDLAAQEAQPPAAPAAPASPAGILDLDIEQLSRVDVVAPSLDVEVTSVSRSESTIGKSPAAIFVITNQMIKDSAAREIPEILRMVPGMNVQRISGNKWAVSIRGFNSRFSNKLLVQIDGRTVYNPLFGGVYWDVQDTVLEDVDRIEVIRGPGATVWGANAVNGIINIITKNSADTQGTYVEAGAGDQWTGYTTVRRGGKVGNLSYRVYGKWFERDDSITAPGFTLGPLNLGPADDDWRQARGGFRADWQPDKDTLFTVQGEGYDGFSSQRQVGFGAFPNPVPPPPFFPIIANIDTGEHVRGWHLLSRYSKKLDDDTDYSAQLYYDQAERHVNDQSVSATANQTMVDFDSQYRFRLTRNQEVIAGFGYRNTDDFVFGSPGVPAVPNLAPPYGAAIYPNQQALDTFSYFVQDKITLLDDLWYLTIGSKFSHYTFATFEMQPSIRFLLTPDQRHAYWAAVSRAVRFPTRADRGISLNTPFFGAVGNPFFRSEDVLAYEMGARGQPVDDFFWDLALFYNDYSDLSSTVPAASGVLQLANNPAHSQTYGYELAGTLQMTDRWQVRPAYSFMRGNVGMDGTPRNTVYVMSTRQLNERTSLDMIYRYVDAITAAPFTIAGPTMVPSYVQMDARFSWQQFRNVEWYVVGRNLLDKYQNQALSEQSGTIGSEVPREVYAGMNLRY